MHFTNTTFPSIFSSSSGVLFFLGILLSVGAMDSAGILRSLAEVLDKNIPNDAIVAGEMHAHII